MKGQSQVEFGELNQTDIDAVKDNSISRGILSKQPQETDFSYALRHEGKVLGIGGIRMLNATTAYGWVDLSRDSDGYIIVCFRTIKDWIEKLAKDKNIKRLECYVECDFPEAVRMVEHLGFVKEHIMPRFVGERSAYLFTRHFNFDGE